MKDAAEFGTPTRGGMSTATSLSICDGLEAYPPLEQVFFQIAFIDIQSFYEV